MNGSMIHDLEHGEHRIVFFVVEHLNLWDAAKWVEVVKTSIGDRVQPTLS